MADQMFTCFYDPFSDLHSICSNASNDFEWWPPQNSLQASKIASNTGQMNGSNDENSTPLRLCNIDYTVEKFSGSKSKDGQNAAFFPPRPVEMCHGVSGYVSDDIFQHLPLPCIPSSRSQATPDQKSTKTNLKPAQADLIARTKRNGLQQSALKKNGVSKREVHIYSERQRRRDMRQLFSTMQSLLPEQKLKRPDRCTVLTDVVEYIHLLRDSLEHLARKKAELLKSLAIRTKPSLGGTKHMLKMQGDSVARTSDSSIRGSVSSGHGEQAIETNVRVLVCGDDAFITMSSSKTKGLWSAVLLMLLKHNLEVVNTTLTTSTETSFHCFHAKVADTLKIDSVNLQKALEDQIRALYHASKLYTVAEESRL